MKLKSLAYFKNFGERCLADLDTEKEKGTFIQAYQQYSPSIIGLSAFTTESRKEMEKVINAFHKKRNQIAKLLNHATNVWLMLVTLGDDLEKRSKEYFRNNEVFSGYRRIHKCDLPALT